MALSQCISEFLHIACDCSVDYYWLPNVSRISKAWKRYIFVGAKDINCCWKAAMEWEYNSKKNVLPKQILISGTSHQNTIKHFFKNFNTHFQKPVVSIDYFMTKVGQLSSVTTVAKINAVKIRIITCP